MWATRSGGSEFGLGSAGGPSRLRPMASRAALGQFLGAALTLHVARTARR